MVSTTWRQTASEVRARGAVGAMPAALTRMSSPPSASRARAKPARTLSGSATSMVRATRPAAAALDLGRHRVDLGPRARGHRDRRPRRGEVEGDGAADPATAAGDQGPASGQRQHCLHLNDLAGAVKRATL